MCGFNVIFRKDSKFTFSKFLEASKSLKQRGPDSSTYIITPYMFLSFHRLAINDLSTSGNQPFVGSYVDEKKHTHHVHVVVNGEIYNYQNLVDQYQLKDKLKSKSDCEVIFHMYMKSKEDNNFYHQLNGDFAYVIVDYNLNRKKVDLSFGRDTFGVRPLFYSKDLEGLSSLATPLLQMGCEDVKQFSPFPSNSKDVNYTITDYFDKLDSDRKIYNSLSFKSTQNVLRDILIESVKKRLMSDKPIGCFLSGGLDSSIIASILVSLCGKDKVRTYSVGMKGSTDLKYARIMADYLGVHHTEVVFTEEEGLKVIPEVIINLESYDITTVRASVGMYILSKWVSENTNDKVIFSGEGSDELFCGYLYWKNSPSVKDSAEESKNLTRQLYQYDVLRADRMVSCNGLELRVPFLDLTVADFAFTINPEHKVPMKNGVLLEEKRLLREAFKDMLHPDIYARQKCAFSDGVSQVKRSWYQVIQEFAETQISDFTYNCLKQKYKTKESIYYHMLFDFYFPKYNLNLPTWLPKWSNATDPSARTLSVCDEK
jgi:asparagine synthase (glutamine-hydrolysing)